MPTNSKVTGVSFDSTVVTVTSGGSGGGVSGLLQPARSVAKAARIPTHRSAPDNRRRVLVGDPAGQVGGTVQAGPFLVVRTHDVPGCILRVGGRQHGIPCPGIFIPTLAGLAIQRAQCRSRPLHNDAWQYGRSSSKLFCPLSRIQTTTC